MLTHVFLEDYKRFPLKLYPEIVMAHIRGWSYADWRIMGMTARKHKRFLSTRQYCRMHPFTGAESSWIDDKLTLKYIVSGTELDSIMPRYYFQLEKDRVIALMDAPKNTNTGISSVINLIKEKNGIALKRIKASLGEGFYKIIPNSDNSYTVNDKMMNTEELGGFLKGLSGYLVLELFRPHPQFAMYSDKSVGCLRYLIGRKFNGDIVDIYSFMRVGTRKSGSVENYVAGGVLLIVKEGRYDYGNILDFATHRNLQIERHPDNGEPLKGEIPGWDKIKEISHQIADLMPQVNYMGIDFVLTDKEEIKILEINSLSSVDALQFEESLLEGSGRDFYLERLSQN